MKIVSKLLSDILLLKPDKVISKGFDEISFSNMELAKVGISTKFVQENESQSGRNVLRGLHYQIQHPQGKLIRVVFGAIFDVVVDLRKSSDFFGRATSFELSAENGLLVWIPPGHAHGFYVTSEDAIVIYSVTDYRFPEFERTLLWSDSDLNIDWPFEVEKPILSEKDASGLLFKEIEVFN